VEFGLMIPCRVIWQRHCIFNSDGQMHNLLLTIS
jgi:hypothetical protein